CDQTNLDAPLPPGVPAMPKVICKVGDIFWKDEFGKRTADQLVWIVPEKGSTRDVDFLDHSIFIEAGIADRRKIVEICVSPPRLRELFLRQSKLAILNFQFELVHVKLAEEVAVHGLRFEQRLEGFKEFVCSFPFQHRCSNTRCALSGLHSLRSSKQKPGGLIQPPGAKSKKI